MRILFQSLVFLGLLLCLLPTFAAAQTEPQQIHLWPNGAPGFENRRDEPEQAKDWWVRNIHNPSITVYLPPREKATGAAVLVCPGGGHRNLVYNSEGRDAALYLNSIGVAAIDDDCCASPIISLLRLYHAAHISAEVHIYAQGAHAFNMGNAPN